MTLCCHYHQLALSHNHCGSWPSNEPSGCLQICVRWNLQCGHAVIPKSVTDSRIVENLQIVKFEIPKAQMDELNAISHQMRMLDGAFVCGPNTPYPTIDDLWDGEVRHAALPKCILASGNHWRLAQIWLPMWEIICVTEMHADCFTQKYGVERVLVLLLHAAV